MAEIKCHSNSEFYDIFKRIKLDNIKSIDACHLTIDHILDDTGYATSNIELDIL